MPLRGHFQSVSCFFYCLGSSSLSLGLCFLECFLTVSFPRKQTLSQVQMVELANEDAREKAGKTNGTRTICCCGIKIPQSWQLKNNTHVFNLTVPVDQKSNLGRE